MKTRFPVVMLAVSLSLVAALSACGNDQVAAQGATPPTPVDTMTVHPRSLALSRDLPGRIEPVRVAEVRARVAGIVLSRAFREGAMVEAGQVLFRIDPAPFEAAVQRYQAELAQAEAALFDAESVVRRYQPLVEIEAVSQQDFDTAQTTLKRAKAAKLAAQANLKTAELDLEHATVTAPISGRIGAALVTEGALVGLDQATPLAVIQQMDPIYADIKQSAAVATKLRAQLANQGLNGEGAPMSLKLDGSDETREGRLLFSDVTVDRSTGELTLRGEFPNPDGLLLPGMYVRVQVVQGEDPAAILIPQRAVQRSSDGKPYVLVVDENQVATSREVTTGDMYGAEWHITGGLEDGDQIVVDGGSKVRAGDKVAVNPVQTVTVATSAGR
ncbi:multidrug efflux RND transporter periplasmic adaptor subunit MexC [Spongiibacter taiwanensis]|uniref:efflux RND transporter periplasmic adaptor subunit n=1 Tax=Spongiibacter taiwanensis TaxID=1748242 RepID=UPI002554F1FD|nr:efflux RND transporter periplasmic adaptor subunit [Spongiibacter taiwanensis]